jgi:hypothetical protein
METVTPNNLGSPAIETALPQAAGGNWLADFVAHHYHRMTVEIP